MECQEVPDVSLLPQRQICFAPVGSQKEKCLSAKNITH